jgi:DNA repair exonuclease SbcCD ATPase subunit
MWKKLGIVALIVVAGALLLGKTKAGQKVSSLAGLYWDKAGCCIDNSVSPEVEIQRLKRELSKRDKKIGDAISQLAAEDVKVKRTKKEIEVARANLKSQLEKIQVMKEDLKSGEQFIKYGENKYPAERVKNELARDWAAYLKAEEALKSKEKMFESMEAAFNNAKEQVAEMRSQYEQLELKLAQLEAELSSVRLAQSRSKFQLDDSHLARIKGDMDELERKVDTMSTELRYKTQYAGSLGIKVEKKVDSADLVKQIEDHLNGKSDKVADNK